MTRRVRAAEFVEPSASVVDTAEQVAKAVLRELGTGEDVVLDVREVRGASTAFFNVILLRVREAVGVDRMDRDVSFELGSSAQRLVFERSLAAVKAEA